MIYKDSSTIKYSFLRNAILVLSEKYTSFEKVYMDSNGELALTFKGKLTEDTVKDILKIITPTAHFKDTFPILFQDYDYSEDESYTQIFSVEGIDYRKTSL